MMSDPAYRVIAADPPWQHKSQGGKKGASEHYKLMTNEGIETYLQDEEIESADNAVLFLWRVASMQQEALNTVRAWGFVLKTELVWNKMTKHGKKHFGMGSYTRASHETCLIAIRGSCRPLVFNQRSTFEARVGRHSAKPDEFYQIVERMYDGPRIELFARKTRPGWDHRGNEVYGEQRQIQKAGRRSQGNQHAWGHQRAGGRGAGRADRETAAAKHAMQTTPRGNLDRYYLPGPGPM